MPKARVFFIQQAIKHPETHIQLWSIEQIEEALDHKVIKEWAWCLHDRDIWTEDDELNDSSHVAGQPKNPHIHVVINLPKNATDVDVIAKWFSVPSNFIEIKRGRGAFLDCVEYLTHEHPNQQALGKHLYTDEEVHANFDFRTALKERAESRAKYGVDVDRKTDLRLKVLSGELSLRAVKEIYPVNYVDDLQRLQKLRLQYISSKEPPKTRTNFYICGSGGIGKGVCSEALAHCLFPDIENDEELYFRIGAEGSTFDGYDAQPVIIWDDCRACDLLNKLKSRGNVFNVFDTSPHKQNQNIKYGSINLVNAVNIVNSVQPWEEFLNCLVDEYIDKTGEKHESEQAEKSQSYRRFPVIIPLRENDFDILLNNKYFYGLGDYSEYQRYKTIKGNFGILARSFPDIVDVVKIGSTALYPVAQVIENNKKVVQSNESVIQDFGSEILINSQDSVIKVGEENIK